jgi:hypothetical protein
MAAEFLQEHHSAATWRWGGGGGQAMEEATDRSRDLRSMTGVGSGVRQITLPIAIRTMEGSLHTGLQLSTGKLISRQAQEEVNQHSNRFKQSRTKQQRRLRNLAYHTAIAANAMDKLLMNAM